MEITKNLSDFKKRKQTELTDIRIREILESITDAFYSVDACWHLTYIN
ncbi:MAG: hypothetical protein GX800_11610 [Clostridiaceae bacterium]|nr:hypothetical protein [Clostridiaceae bacterium]